MVSGTFFVSPIRNLNLPATEGLIKTGTLIIESAYTYSGAITESEKLVLVIYKRIEAIRFYVNV